MTEYGRGTGSQSWDSEDPLYGDPGWGEQQAETGHDPYGQGAYVQDPYGYQQYGQGYPQQDQQQPQQQQPQQQWDGQGQGYPQQQYPQQQYGGGDGGTGGWDGSYGGMDPHDPYAQPADPYGGAQGDYYGGQGGYPQPEQYPQQPGQYPQQGQPQQYPQGQHPQGQQYPQQPQPQHPQQPQPQQPEQPQAQPHQHQAQQPQARQHRAAEPPPLPEPEPDEPEHRFFQDDGDADEPERQRAGRERRGKQPKRRSGVACLVVSVVLVGAVGGGGYYGYQFWQSHFGAPPDYSGQGTGQVDVEVPEGAGGAMIGNLLTDKGVVKSSRAFVAAVDDSGKSIQPGTYTLRKEMSAAAAVKLMTDPASLNALIVHEGERNAAVYAAIDQKIGLKAGTTKDVAQRKADSLGLPSWADDNSKIKDPLEGFLYPSRYSVGKNAKPEDVLKKMIAQAKQHYAAFDLEGKADEMGLKSPLQLLTVASLVQAEGVTSDDFRKMAEVVYNRLKPGNPQTYGKIEFDSTYNYIKNQSKLDISISEIKHYDNPYNTYFYKGLPPGPIGNPGDDALNASANPTSDGWYFFVSIDGKKTHFTKTYAEHQKYVDKFNKSRQ